MTLGFGRHGNTGLALIGTGMLSVLIGVSLLSPWLGRPLTRLFELGYRRGFGTVGTLAAQNSIRNPRRTAATASALMIGLTLVSLIAILGQSAAASTAAAVDKAVTSELVVSNVVQVPFSTSVAKHVRQVPGVSSVAEVRSAGASVGHSQVFVGAVDPRELGLALAVPTKKGSLLALRGDTIAITSAAAERHHFGLGDVVPMRFQGGVQRLRVVAILSGSSPLPYGYLVTLRAMAKGGIAPLDTLLFVNKDPGADASEVRREVKNVVKDLPTVTVQDPAEFAQSQKDQVDFFLNIIYGLLALAIVIALLGIVNTLALSVIERTREVGLLRAVGVSRRQLRRMVRLESVVVAVLGAVLGVGMGLVFGIALQRSIADQGVDVLSVPWGQLVLFVVLAAVAGVLAAVLPARRAARLDVLSAIGTE
jgi:putative ABC transport system permease protein